MHKGDASIRQAEAAVFESSLALPWIAVAADILVILALGWGMFRTRMRGKWGVLLLALTVVAIMHLGESIAHTLTTHETELATVAHLAVVVALLVMTMVLRREWIVPQRLMESLADSESTRDQYIDGIENVVATLTPDGTVRHINRRGLDLLGLSSSDLVGKRIFDVLCDETSRPDIQRGFGRFVRTAGRTSADVEYPVMTPRGTRVIKWRRSAVLDEHGSVVGVISAGEDVTQRLRLQASLEAESLLLDSVRDSVIVVDLNGELLYFNHAAHSLRGYSHNEFCELELFGWVAPESRNDALIGTDKTLRDGSSLFEVTNLTKDGRRFPMEVRAQTIDFEGKPAIAMVARDVSERKEAQEMVARMAFRDSLTGLPNRRLVYDRIELALAQAHRTGEPLYLLYLDIDGLKGVNDSLGHDGGDQLIKQAGQRLSLQLREGDTLGRVGGDEFIVILDDCEDEATALEISNRLVASLANPFEVRESQVRATLSIGVSYCAHELTTEQAVQRADRAMYAAKQAGGNRAVLYTDEMECAISCRFELKNQLRDALEREEFVLHYQPIVDAQRHTLTGAEALIRWNHPARGMLPPSEFMDVVEESGLSVAVGRWVLLTACQQLAQWRHQGIAVPRVGVNLSPSQFLETDIVHEVSEILAQTGLDAQSLELELTESAAMRDASRSLPVFEQLSSMGIALALDDFGTGHSSLARLQSMPIDTIKIDRSFVTDLCSVEQRNPIIDTMMLLARSLELSIIAEGVETSCQLEYLASSGCQEIQGFLFSRPVPPDVFASIAQPGRLEPREAEDCPQCLRATEHLTLNASAVAR